MIRTRSALMIVWLLSACGPVPSREATSRSAVLAQACESQNASCRHQTCEQSCAAQCAAQHPDMQSLGATAEVDGSNYQNCHDLCVTAKCDSPSPGTCTTDPNCSFACDVRCQYSARNDERSRTECKSACYQKCPCL